MQTFIIREILFLLSYLTYGVLNLYLVDRTLRYRFRRPKLVYPLVSVMAVVFSIVNTLGYEGGRRFQTSDIVIVSIHLDSAFFILIYIFIVCVIMFFSIKEKWWKKILVIFFSTLLIQRVSDIFVNASAVAMPVTVPEQLNGVVSSILVTFVFSVLEFLFFVLIAKMGDRRNDKPFPILPLIALVIIIATLSDVAIDGVLYTDDISRTPVFTILMLICLTVIVTAVYISGVNRERADLKLLNRQNEEFLDAQTKHFERSAEADTEVRAMRHDMKNNIQVLMLLLQNGEYDKMRDYLEEMGEDLQKADISIHTGSSIADAIISEKMADAASKGITLKCGGVISGVKFSPVDTCKILANMLDNAIEACEDKKIKDIPDRTVDLQFKRTDNHFMICCTNPSSSYVDLTVDDVESKKSDRKMHGFGVYNIKTAAANYGGEINSECKETSCGYLFSLDIIFPVEG